MRIILFAVTGLFLGLVPAFAHGYAGGRYFPATILTEDPFVADELALPTFTHRKGGEEPGAREDEWEFEFAKRVSDNFALSIEGGWSREKGDENSVDGFANLTLGAKYQLLVDEDAEFALAAGLGVELGGTGSAHLDVADFNTYEPAVLFGKGFGDLGEATSLLRPFAVTGFAGVSIPEHGHGNLVYGGAVEYSMAYLHASKVDPIRWTSNSALRGVNSVSVFFGYIIINLFCCCLRCGDVGNAFAFSKRSGISTVLVRLSSFAPSVQTCIGVALPSA